MRLSDLQQKDIVSINDGRRLGRIIDAEISEDGQIIRLIVEEKLRLRNIFNNSGEVSIYFSNIKKIGNDVILVDL